MLKTEKPGCSNPQVRDYQTQRASEASGFEAACRAALRVVEGGRVPDDATVDVLARRMAAGGGDAPGGPDLGVYDGFLKGAAADGR